MVSVLCLSPFVLQGTHPALCLSSLLREREREKKSMATRIFLPELKVNNGSVKWLIGGVRCQTKWGGKSFQLGVLTGRTTPSLLYPHLQYG
jgi:hypothetical protein